MHTAHIIAGHGNALATSIELAGAEPQVWLYMPTLGGEWTAVSRIVGGGDAAMA